MVGAREMFVNNYLRYSWTQRGRRRECPEAMRWQFGTTEPNQKWLPNVRLSEGMNTFSSTFLVQLQSLCLSLFLSPSPSVLSLLETLMPVKYTVFLHVLKWKVKRRGLLAFFVAWKDNDIEGWETQGTVPALTTGYLECLWAAGRLLLHLENRKGTLYDRQGPSGSNFVVVVVLCVFTSGSLHLAPGKNISITVLH